MRFSLITFEANPIAAGAYNVTLVCISRVFVVTFYGRQVRGRSFWCSAAILPLSQQAGVISLSGTLLYGHPLKITLASPTSVRPARRYYLTLTYERKNKLTFSALREKLKENCS